MNCPAPPGYKMGAECWTGAGVLCFSRKLVGNSACYPKTASMQGSTMPLHAWQPQGLCPASIHPNPTLPGMRCLLITH